MIEIQRPAISKKQKLFKHLFCLRESNQKSILLFCGGFFFVYGLTIYYMWYFAQWKQIIFFGSHTKYNTPGLTMHTYSKLFFFCRMIMLKKTLNELAYLFYYLWAYFVWSFSALSFCTDFTFVLKLPRSSDAHAWDHKLNKSFVKYFDQILIHKQNWII